MADYCFQAKLPILDEHERLFFSFFLDRPTGVSPFFFFPRRFFVVLRRLCSQADKPVFALDVVSRSRLLHQPLPITPSRTELLQPIDRPVVITITRRKAQNTAVESFLCEKIADTSPAQIAWHSQTPHTTIALEDPYFLLFPCNPHFTVIPTRGR